MNFFIWVNANGLLLLLRKKDAHGRVAKCPMCIFDASGFYSSTGIECSNGSSLEKRGLRLAIHESSSFWKRVIEIYRVTCWVLREISTQKCKLKF